MIWVISGEIEFKVKIEADSEEEAISIVESNLGILDDDGDAIIEWISAEETEVMIWVRY